MTSTKSHDSSPVRLTGELDPNLSRWLWLVKMFLAIPHYVVLAFLLIAFLITTVGVLIAQLRPHGHRRLSMKLKAFVIPADSSKPVRPIDFDQDKTWRYVLTKYRDPAKPPWNLTEVAFLTKENASHDYLLPNSRANEYLKKSLRTPQLS